MPFQTPFSAREHFEFFEVLRVRSLALRRNAMRWWNGHTLAIGKIRVDFA
jgi:hypothetical protein